MTSIKNIINNAVRSRRTFYYKLNDHEKLGLVSILLDQSDTALVDADHDLHLQKAVADTILNDGNHESLQKLYQVIKEIFVDGYTNEVGIQHEPYYAETIDDLLYDEDTAPNEHFQQDTIQRARDVRGAQW